MPARLWAMLGSGVARAHTLCGRRDGAMRSVTPAEAAEGEGDEVRCRRWDFMALPQIEEVRIVAPSELGCINGRSWGREGRSPLRGPKGEGEGSWGSKSGVRVRLSQKSCGLPSIPT